MPEIRALVAVTIECPPKHPLLTQSAEILNRVLGFLLHALRQVIKFLLAFLLAVPVDLALEKSKHPLASIFRQGGYRALQLAQRPFGCSHHLDILIGAPLDQGVLGLDYPLLG